MIAIEIKHLSLYKNDILDLHEILVELEATVEFYYPPENQKNKQRWCFKPFLKIHQKKIFSNR